MPNAGFRVTESTEHVHYGAVVQTLRLDSEVGTSKDTNAQLALIEGKEMRIKDSRGVSLILHDGQVEGERGHSASAT